jgi:CheY-like chemotaxis protein
LAKSCGDTAIQHNSQPAVDLIHAGSGELFILARILVVDDDAAVQMTVRLLLERAGHSVVTADGGRKGLALCETGNFDLLFLDIFMPGMDGFETMRMVRQHRPLIPIIVISGRPVAEEADTAPDFLTMATKLGAVSSLQKPFRPADLLAAVARCLEAVDGGASRPADGVASSR